MEADRRIHSSVVVDALPGMSTGRVAEEASRSATGPGGFIFVLSGCTGYVGQAVAPPVMKRSEVGGRRSLPTSSAVADKK